MVYKAKIQVTINTVLIIVLVVIFEVIPLMNTIAGNTSRHITHPSDFVCWFIPSMGHLVWRFAALLTTWLLKVSWQPIKAHSNELCLITCWTCWQDPACDEWILGNCSIRTNLVLPRMSWPVSVMGWKIWLISRHPTLSSSFTPANNRHLLSVFVSKRRS